MRKFLPLLLCIFLVLGGLTPAFAAVPKDIEGTELEKSVSEILELGIMQGYPDGTFRPDQPVTRAEMAKIIITALELDDSAIKLYGSSLTDIGKHWAKGYVAYMDKLDLASGYTDGTFKPQNQVTFNEAVTMIVRALGYTKLDGSWPSNYIAKAAELGILEKDFSRGAEKALRGDVALLISNAIRVPISDHKEDTILNRLTTTERTYETWQIPYGERLIHEYGLEGAVTDSADSILNSSYWQMPDFYNMTSNDRLTILTNFKTTQQTNGWTCGPASVLMNLEWYGMRGDLNEMDLASLRQKDEPGATSLKQMINIFEGLEKNLGQKWNIFSTYDAKVEPGNPSLTYQGKEISFFDWIPQMLKEGKPIIVGWNDWGGHYQVIIGYDTMGTETTADDTLILADPYDTTDHNQDGYLIQSAERLIYDWSASWDPDFDYGIFLVATPEGVNGKPLVKGSGIADDPFNKGRFTNEHMIPYGDKLAADIKSFSQKPPYSTTYKVWFGADGLSGPASADVFRTADYKNSPYYKSVDAYNLKSGKTLTMLEKYKTVQQATEFTCGVTSMLTVLDWFGARGDLNEINLADLRDKKDGKPGTTVQEMLNVIQKLPGKWDVKSSLDIVKGDSNLEAGIMIDGKYTDLGEMIPYYIKKGIPVMVMWHEWGGHYQTIIGYDTMGTEATCDDVLILADSYDTTDHNQDGYVIESYERLIYDWGNSYDDDVDWAAFVVMSPAK